ncbi:SAM-dependent methyltransferase [Actinomadura darangshiensis]|uniref:SAM-dependent methyltransferase n=1 Tax=Actinomadura darangshiensis TaxID=705336 RepID=A0A4R5B595_9ACTN|nr:SAM-dependent methyltransferase [Actinomadura darangshiensis]TDD80143.1 SAM-dependent methyltransferase [Actinomadura darangshiensis]
MNGDSSASQPQQRSLDTSVAHTARVWNWFLGGKDNYMADQAAGTQVAEVNPDVIHLARASRAFLVRGTSYLTGEAGIRQFLDIGTGLPTANNTHEVAQSIAPESRIVYVDNDPLVLVHAEALLSSTPDGVTHYIEADLQDPETILHEAAGILDFDQPIAIMLIAILHHIPDTGKAQAIVRRLLEAVPPGSHLGIAHAAHSEAMDRGAAEWNKVGKPPLVPRHPEEIAAFFEGLDMLEPGLVTTTRWRPDGFDLGVVRDVDQLAGIGRKP